MTVGCVSVSDGVHMTYLPLLGSRDSTARIQLRTTIRITGTIFISNFRFFDLATFTIPPMILMGVNQWYDNNIYMCIIISAMHWIT